jgi:hypothetical protein
MVNDVGDIQRKGNFVGKVIETSQGAITLSIFLLGTVTFGSLIHNRGIISCSSNNAKLLYEDSSLSVGLGQA